jgi:hypothetical protein
MQYLLVELQQSSWSFFASDILEAQKKNEIVKRKKKRNQCRTGEKMTSKQSDPTRILLV